MILAPKNTCEDYPMKKLFLFLISFTLLYGTKNDDSHDTQFFTTGAGKIVLFQVEEGSLCSWDPVENCSNRFELPDTNCSPGSLLKMTGDEKKDCCWKRRWFPLCD